MQESPASRPREPRFPRNIASWRNYTGLRALAVTLLALSLAHLAGTCYSTTFERESYRRAAQARVDNRGALKKGWAKAVWLLWDRTPEPEQAIASAESAIAGRRLWSAAGVVLAWFAVWLAFDWDKARHFVFAGLSVGAGIAYSLLPVDLVPDFIPVAGAADDVAVNVFSAGLGAASVAEYYRTRRRRELMSMLAARHPEAALDVLLDDCGLEPSGSEALAAPDLSQPRKQKEKP